MTLFRVFTSAVLLSFALGGTGPLAAQSREETLADIRQDMAVLYTEIQRLKRELSTTGGAQTPGGGGTALQRLDAIEAQVQRLTARSEELEFRVDRVVRDGTNRIGDLEFRLCELEANCDLSALGTTSTLGGGAAAPDPQPAPQPAQPTVEMAVGEQADFDRALAQLEGGNSQAAADAFARFVEVYPVGTLTTDAHYFRGEALKSLGQTASAARSFLEAFSGAPKGPRAADSLFNLGVALNQLGQKREACVTLGEVSTRFPGSLAAADAAQAVATMGCT